jgi:hypothetical protein
MRYSTEILRRLDPLWPSRLIDVITFPYPPVLNKGVMVAADSWSSDALERGSELFGRERQCLKTALTNRGPAFLLRLPLGDLIQPGGSIRPIYCATISYQTLIENPTVTYASRVILESVMEIGRSCHKASHTVVPSAPLLSLLLELQFATNGVEGFKFADPYTAGLYFPTHDFAHNGEVDHLFRFASIGEAIGRDNPKEVIVPNSISPRLASLMRQRLVSNEFIRQSHRAPLEYMDAVIRRDSLVMEAQNGTD